MKIFDDTSDYEVML